MEPTGQATDPELEALRRRRMEQLVRPAPVAPVPAKAAGPVSVTDASFGSFVSQNRLALLDLWADWCGPCHALAPTVDEVAREVAGRVAVGKLDVDRDPATMRRFGVMGIPTLLLFRDGRLVERLVGVEPKGRILEALKKHGA